MTHRLNEPIDINDINLVYYCRKCKQKVREDIAETERCFYADAYKSTVVMYRRAIQNIVLDGALG